MSREVHITLDETTKRKLQTLAESYSNKDLFYSNAQQAQDEIKHKIKNILPTQILNSIENLTETGGPDVVSISNLPTDENASGEGSLEERINNKTKYSEYLLTGISGLLNGTLQAEESSHQPGLIHQITPVQSFEHEASGRGLAALPFHVENVFIKNPPSFLCLFCISGEKSVGTDYIFLEDIVKYLDNDTINTLKKPIFTVKTGDGFNEKALHNTSVIENLSHQWYLGRFYEEDRIFSDDENGKLAIEKLHDAIVKARDAQYNSVSLSSGMMLMFRNGIGKEKVGGIMHGRNGNIKQKPQAQSNKLRWLQRVCVEIDYR